MRRALFSLLMAAAISVGDSAVGDVNQRLEAAFDECRRDGGYVLLAIVSEETAQNVREALKEPSRVGELTRYRHVVALGARHPMLCVRFGARSLPLFVLLDGRGSEIARSTGARSPSEIVRTLEQMGTSALDVAKHRIRLKESPADREALSRLADHHWQRQELFRATDYYRRLLATQSSQSEEDRRRDEVARERVGNHLVKSSRWTAARELFRQVDLETARGRHGDWIALHLALVLREESRHQESLDVLRRRLEAFPNGPLADRLLFTLAFFERESGRTLDALERLGELEDRFPHSRYGRRARRALSKGSAFSDLGF